MNGATQPKPKVKKAYSVQGYEAGAIVFATSSIEARRLGANQIDQPFEDIESCRRAPYADEYVAQGKVPALVLIANGWWFECGHCGARVCDDSTHDDDDETPHQPVEENNWVFCSPKCQQAEHDERAARQARKQRVIETVAETFPGAEVKWVDDSEPARCAFTFPGGKTAAYWRVGEETVELPPADHAAWEIYRGRAPAPEASHDAQ